MNKYRAWDKEKKKMYVVYGWNESTNEIYIRSLPESAFKGGVLHTTHVVTKQLDKYILMQSTGLKGYMDDSFNDREEKEVFQGDIIDIFWEEWPVGCYQENHMIGVVDLDATGTAWIIKNAKYDFDNPEPIPNKIGDMEISRSLPDDEELEEVFLHNFNLTSDDITILGNIHANPELLEEVE